MRFDLRFPHCPFSHLIFLKSSFMSFSHHRLFSWYFSIHLLFLPRPNPDRVGIEQEIGTRQEYQLIDIIHERQTYGSHKLERRHMLDDLLFRFAGFNCGERLKLITRDVQSLREIFVDPEKSKKNFIEFVLSAILNRSARLHFMAHLICF